MSACNSVRLRDSFSGRRAFSWRGTCTFLLTCSQRLCRDLNFLWLVPTVSAWVGFLASQRPLLSIQRSPEHGGHPAWRRSGSEGAASPLSQRFRLPLSPLPLYPVAKATCPLGFPFSLQKQSLTSALQPGPVGRCLRGFSLEGFWSPAPPPAPPTPAGPGACNCALWTGHQAVR